jgi:DNA-binding MarR family transcriptional regulator
MPQRKSDRPSVVPEPAALGTAGAGGDLSAYTGYQLRRAQIALFSHFTRTFADLDLRPAQFSLLVIVDAHPAIQQSRAGAMLGIQKANFVPFVGKLQRRGLLVRIPLDGRTNGLRLTAKGRALLRRARRAVDVHEAAVTRGLSASEKRMLFSMLRRITAASAPPLSDEAGASRSA